MPKLFDYCSEANPTYYYYLTHANFEKITIKNGVRWYLSSDGCSYILSGSRLLTVCGYNRAAHYFDQIANGDLSSIDAQDSFRAEVKSLIRPKTDYDRKLAYERRERFLESQRKFWRK